MTKIKYTEEDIGSEVLYALSKGLYSEPYHVVREYLQNAVDAFPKTIDMTIQNNSIYFYDDGEGMDSHDIDICRKVGITEKDPKIHVGFRGIGIWAGLIYARCLRITSTKRDVNKKYILTIDFEKIAEGIKKEKILTTLLSQHVDLKEDNEEPAKHYTFVELCDITEIGKKLVSDYEALRNYIATTLPVDFPDSFKYKKRVNDLLSANVRDYRTVELKFNGKLVYKPYPEIEDLLEPEGYIISDDNKKQIGYAWACLRYKEMKKYHGGLVYKIKGFTIGNTETPRMLWRNIWDHLHWWCFGEIHITDLEVTPNTAREDLEPSEAQRSFVPAAEKIVDELRIKIGNLSKKETAKKKSGKAEDTLSQIEPQITKIEKLDLNKLYDVKKDTEKNIGELEYRKKTLEKLPAKEKKEIEKKIDEYLEKLSTYKEKINGEITIRDKKFKVLTKKTRPKKPKMNEIDKHMRAFDGIKSLNEQSMLVLRIVVENIAKIIMDEMKIDELINAIKKDIQKKIR